jgi:hypothetical protein
MAQDRQLLDWQQRMASFMTASIIVAAAFFAIVTVWQFRSFQATFAKAAPAIDDVWARQPMAPSTYEQQFELARTARTCT